MLTRVTLYLRAPDYYFLVTAIAHTTSNKLGLKAYRRSKASDEHQTLYSTTDWATLWMPYRTNRRYTRKLSSTGRPTSRKLLMIGRMKKRSTGRYRRNGLGRSYKSLKITRPLTSIGNFLRISRTIIYNITPVRATSDFSTTNFFFLLNDLPLLQELKDMYMSVLVRGAQIKIMPPTRAPQAQGTGTLPGTFAYITSIRGQIPAAPVSVTAIGQRNYRRIDLYKPHKFYFKFPQTVSNLEFLDINGSAKVARQLKNPGWMDFSDLQTANIPFWMMQMTFDCTNFANGAALMPFPFNVQVTVLLDLKKKH